MYPFERKDKIITLLKDKGTININQDARTLGVSRSTLHRDLGELQRLGVVKKVRGGATLREENDFVTHFDIRLKKKMAQKQEIARKAAASIRDDTAIFLDHSSSTLYLASELKNIPFRNLIVVSNSLAVADELGGRQGIQVILTGGIFESEFRALSGRRVLESLHSFNFHALYISVGAISAERGLMTTIPFIHELLPEIFKMSGDIIVLVDSSKFHKIGTFQVAPLKAPLTIYTDSGISEEILEELAKTNVKIAV